MTPVNSCWYEEAATKFNILKGKDGSLLAEDAFYKLAMLWLKVGELERSVDFYRRALRLNPRDAETLGNRLALSTLADTGVDEREGRKALLQLIRGTLAQIEADGPRAAISGPVHPPSRPDP